MRIRILGTAAAEGWPALFCGCEPCGRARRAGGKNLRSRASVLINENIKIDFNPDSLHQSLVHGLDYSLLEHLLITHSHPDHLAPPELGYLRPPFAHNRAAGALNIWSSRDVADVIRGHFPDPSELGVVLNEVTPFVSVDLGGLKATPVIAVHMERELCLNWVLGELDHAVLYASDTGLYRTPTWEFLAGVKFDLVVTECTHGFEGQPATHMSVPSVVALRDQLDRMGSLNPGCRVVITHFSHNALLLHEEMEERTAGFGLIVAYDGIELEAGT